MPFVQNVGRQEILDGMFEDPGPNSLLIQICDVGEEHIPAPSVFAKSIRFEFDDVEDANDPASISDAQADSIVKELRQAYANGMNVIVHCYAGIYRSGAVALAAEYVGFHRVPPAPGEVHDSNKLVALKMGMAMGRTYRQKTVFEEEFLDRSAD